MGIPEKKGGELFVFHHWNGGGPGPGVGFKQSSFQGMDGFSTKDEVINFFWGGVGGGTHHTSVPAQLWNEREGEREERLGYLSSMNPRGNPQDEPSGENPSGRRRFPYCLIFRVVDLICIIGRVICAFSCFFFLSGVEVDWEFGVGGDGRWEIVVGWGGGGEGEGGRGKKGRVGLGWVGLGSCERMEWKGMEWKEI